MKSTASKIEAGRRELQLSATASKTRTIVKWWSAKLNSPYIEMGRWSKQRAFKKYLKTNTLTSAIYRRRPHLLITTRSRTMISSTLIASTKSFIKSTSIFKAFLRYLGTFHRYSMCLRKPRWANFTQWSPIWRTNSGISSFHRCLMIATASSTTTQRTSTTFERASCRRTHVRWVTSCDSM